MSFCLVLHPGVLLGGDGAYWKGLNHWVHVLEGDMETQSSLLALLFASWLLWSEQTSSTKCLYHNVLSSNKPRATRPVVCSTMSYASASPEQPDQFVIFQRSLELCIKTNLSSWCWGQSISVACTNTRPWRSPQHPQNSTETNFPPLGCLRQMFYYSNGKLIHQGSYHSPHQGTLLCLGHAKPGHNHLSVSLYASLENEPLKVKPVSFATISLATRTGWSL